MNAVKELSIGSGCDYWPWIIRRRQHGRRYPIRFFRRLEIPRSALKVMTTFHEGSPKGKPKRPLGGAMREMKKWPERKRMPAI